MQKLKSLFIAAEDDSSYAERMLKITKTNIQLNILKANKYIESLGKIKSFKKLLMFLLNLYASENLIEDIQQFEETPIELMEFFVPQIMGFIITHSEIYPELSKSVLKILLKNSKLSTKFSHYIVWNILSCKNNYKKFSSLQNIRGVLQEIIQAGCMNEFDFSFNEYDSIFMQYKDIDTFIDKSLIPVHEIHDFFPSESKSQNNRPSVDKPEIPTQGSTPCQSEEAKEDKIEIKETLNLNGSPDQQFKWRKYLSTLNFVNDLITVSEILKNLNDEYRNNVLMKYIRKFNSQKLPGSIYIPIDLIGKNANIKQSVLRICEDYAFCLSSKERVPFHILVEVMETKQQPVQNNKLSISPYGMSALLTESEREGQIKLEEEKEIEITVNKKEKESKHSSPGLFSSLFLCCYSNVDKNEEKIKTMFGTEKFEEVESKLLKKSPYSQYPNRRIISLIVKGLEDMRQDMFVYQMMQFFTTFFEKDNINIHLEPISIISNGRGGIIQTIVNASSLDRIKKLNPYIENLKHYFIIKYGGYNSKAYKNAVINFIESLAGFSLICYLLQIKDRHNGNILIDDEGRLIHIDFGFLLNHSPGNMNFEKAPFKLTGEYVDLMEGVNSKYFKEFKSLFLNGFITLRKNYKKILSFVEICILTNSDLPCFKDKDKTLSELKERFLISETLDEVKKSVNKLIEDSRDHWRTRFYDGFQKYCVGIK